jgi:hypothetical protein
MPNQPQPNQPPQPPPQPSPPPAPPAGQGRAEGQAPGSRTDAPEPETSKPVFPLRTDDEEVVEGKPAIFPAPLNQQPAFAPSPFQQGVTMSENDPWYNDQAFQDLVREKGYACPGSNVGDHAFVAWMYDFYLGAKGGAAAPEKQNKIAEERAKTQQEYEQKVRTARHDQGVGARK